MNSRERVKRAIDFEKPDRVPYAGFTLGTDVFPLLPMVSRKWQPREPYMPYVTPLETTLGLWKSKRKLPKGWYKAKHLAIDEWGVVWQRYGAISNLGQVFEAPIKSWDDLDKLEMPDPRDPGRYSVFTRLAKVIARKRYTFGALGNFLWERYHFLRGWENSMRDVVKKPKQMHELLDRLAEYFMAVADEWIKRGVNAVMATDDLGGQHEPLMSPTAYKELFLPRFKKIIDYCHDHGVHVLLHSCGDLRELMPSLIDAGLDVFQFDGPDQTGIEYCSEHFGGKVTFMDVVDIQNVMPATRGTALDIVQYTKRLIYYLGRFDGGLISTEYASPSVLRPQKGGFKEMHATIKKHGKYPLDIESLKRDLNVQ
ncbi:MAG TPA: uroporphyrinogen decarboxylase family protein [Candidatus Lokiarchaeia archaeon]|nr:uroporphyrinogen decarboxylase family protein [Candidatus Lokiarchaeia archaeon]